MTTLNPGTSTGTSTGTCTPDLDAVETEARQLLDARMEAIRTLARTRQIVAQRESDLHEARQVDQAAFHAATQVGWTPDELRQVGLGHIETTRTARSARTPRRRTPRTRATPGAPLVPDADDTDDTDDTLTLPTEQTARPDQPAQSGGAGDE